MTVAYAATTEGCTFLLDEDGVCRRVLLRHSRRSPEATLGGRTRSQAARRCIGAQYVASIDVRTEGGLVPMPRIGTPMLFAYTDDDGRIAVVRTGPLSRFETLGPPRESRDEIPVDWVEDEAGPEDADDTAEDALEDAMTVPLHQSGERKTPRRISLFDRDEVHGGDPWVPPRRPSWATMTAAAHVRLQKVDIVPPRGSAPTLKRTSKPTATASAKGMLPKRTVR